MVVVPRLCLFSPGKSAPRTRKGKDKIKEEHTGETIYGLENFLLMPEIFIRHSGYVWCFVSLKSFGSPVINENDGRAGQT